MTEKLLLYGGALQQAGAVRQKAEQRATASDFMEMEKERGISIRFVFFLLLCRHCVYVAFCYLGGVNHHTLLFVYFLYMVHMCKNTVPQL